MTGTKPGNIRFNMGKLYMAIAEGVFNSVGGVLTMPWLLFVAALILWGRLYAAATIQYPENEAAVLWTMWQRRDPKTRTVADAGLFEAVNAERDKYGHSPLSEKEFDEAIRKLLRYETIERYRQDRCR